MVYVRSVLILFTIFHGQPGGMCWFPREGVETATQGSPEVHEIRGKVSSRGVVHWELCWCSRLEKCSVCGGGGFEGIFSGGGYSGIWESSSSSSN